MIDGLVIKPLNKIPDERGEILHMMRSDDPLFERFGEIYFSTVYPGVVKGWHLHEEMTLNYAVVSGMIKLALFDERQDSPTNGKLQEIYMGENNHCLVKIPPRVWNGFMGVGTKQSFVANLATIPHRPDEITRLDPHDNHIPYNWGKSDR
ncbi:dTDP-4-dehydrorhamnose 3,5-epimerase family protein [Acidobacteriota bacterium]